MASNQQNFVLQQVYEYLSDVVTSNAPEDADGYKASPGMNYLRASRLKAQFEQAFAEPQVAAPVTEDVDTSDA